MTTASRPLVQSPRESLWTVLLPLKLLISVPRMCGHLGTVTCRGLSAVTVGMLFP
jgi:hypothetical protein